MRWAAEMQIFSALALPLIRPVGPPSPRKERGEGDCAAVCDYRLLPAVCGEKVANGRMRGSTKASQFSTKFNNLELKNGH